MLVEQNTEFFTTTPKHAFLNTTVINKGKVLSRFLGTSSDNIPFPKGQPFSRNATGENMNNTRAETKCSNSPTKHPLVERGYILYVQRGSLKPLLKCRRKTCHWYFALILKLVRQLFACTLSPTQLKRKG